MGSDHVRSPPTQSMVHALQNDGTVRDGIHKHHFFNCSKFMVRFGASVLFCSCESVPVSLQLLQTSTSGSSRPLSSSALWSLISSALPDSLRPSLTKRSTKQVLPSLMWKRALWSCCFAPDLRNVCLWHHCAWLKLFHLFHCCGEEFALWRFLALLQAQLLFLFALIWCFYQGLRTKPSILGRLRVLSELICCSPLQVLRFAPFWSVWHSRRQSFKSLCPDLIIMTQNVWNCCHNWWRNFQEFTSETEWYN